MRFMSIIARKLGAAVPVRKLGILLGLLIYIAPALALITPPGFVGRVGQHGSAVSGDPTLTLSYNYLIGSGSTMAESVLRGPTPTFTRASNAMSFDSAGILAYAPHQLIRNSNWGNRTGDSPNSWGWTVETGTIAWTDIDDYSQGVFTGPRQALSISVTLVAQETYTLFMYITESAITAGEQRVFEINGTSGTDARLLGSEWDSLGGVPGWYAIGFTMGADTAAQLTIGLGFGGSSTGSVTISRPGIVKGLIAGVGVGNGNGAKLSGEPLGRWIGTGPGDEPLYDQPRFDHDPLTGVALGLLIEEQRTNLLLQSEDLGTSWTATNGAVSTNAVTAPDGNSTADQFDADGGGSAYMQQTAKVVVTNGVRAAVSIFAKYIDNTWLAIRFTDVSGTPSVWFDIQNGTVGTTGGTIVATITDVGDGWFRGTAAETTTTTTIAARFYIATADGTLGTPAFGKGAYLWGAQIEDNSSFSSSYIPTTSAAVTRSADVCSTTDMGWLTQGVGTLYVKGQRAAGQSGFPALVSISDGSENNEIYITNADDDAKAFTRKVGGNDGNLSISNNSWVLGTQSQAALAYATDDMAFSSESVLITDTLADPPTSLTQMNIGRRPTQTYMNGHVAEIEYWNVRKENAFLISKTTTAANDNGAPEVRFAANDNWIEQLKEAVGW